MSTRAVIVGSAFEHWPGLDIIERQRVKTPWGDSSGDIARVVVDNTAFFLMHRHGNDERILPHAINYRANIAALKSLGVRQVVALNVVGGISEAMAPGVLALPHQLIDYTWGRDHSFNDSDIGMRGHVDFTEPYCRDIRQALRVAAAGASVSLIDEGVYAVTQGPRLETAAEVLRLAKDGADMVGMTGMPEAALAREAGLNYAALCTVVNWAAGVGDEPITLDSIENMMSEQAQQLQSVLTSWVLSASRARSNND